MRAALLLPGLALLLGACDGPGVVGPGRVSLGRGGAASPAASLVGTWRRIVYFLDDFNYARSAETSIQFAADGSVIRVQVARNHTLGLADVVVAAGRWRWQGSTITLDFVTPSPFTLTLDARITGDQLELAGQAFLRVSGG